ncbi:MAG: nucleoside-diphosphate kinase [Candidatus Hydrogenedentes bacterium CG07_land_8_20_14_0_80_42_17]|nr:MAG: nucleoside-diphosphate kinase [Candidatus Hydrogenedentes bacterium CG1_02_42_14]PIU48824.1 MAG: nucleoside-diphosphate kinase [Candidatus Hydrogenedentes bacterium CG07_land_8_20_14_0_80_42_17]
MSNAATKEEQALVLIKPDAVSKSLTGNIITMLDSTGLKMVGAKVVKVSKKLAETHYAEHKGKPFFNSLIEFIMGEKYTPRVVAMVYQGPNAIKVLRKLAGNTNPEDAEFNTIRGKYGRINSKTKEFENAVHISDSPESGKREIALWFRPEELVE